MLGPDRTAVWVLASDIAMVGTARALTERQLDAWGLGEDIKHVTVLIVSELVTNAVRHAAAPITLRLIRQETLTCEGSDGSSVAPHLRYALPGDEGGRGLLIVAQSVSRWGIRHGPTGKTVWTEQELARQ
jgi:two-component sensor histidine kinase